MPDVGHGDVHGYSRDSCLSRALLYAHASGRGGSGGLGVESFVIVGLSSCKRLAEHARSPHIFLSSHAVPVYSRVAFSEVILVAGIAAVTLY